MHWIFFFCSMPGTYHSGSYVRMDILCAYVLYTPFHFYMIMWSRYYLNQKWTIFAPARYNDKQMNDWNQSDCTCTYNLVGHVFPSAEDLLSLSREWNILSLVNQHVSDLIQMFESECWSWYTVPQVRTLISFIKIVCQYLCANLCISFACKSLSKQG